MFKGKLTTYEFQCSRLLSVISNWSLGDIVHEDLKTALTDHKEGDGNIKWKERSKKRQRSRIYKKKISIYSKDYVHNVCNMSDFRITDDSIFITSLKNIEMTKRIWNSKKISSKGGGRVGKRVNGGRVRGGSVRSISRTPLNISHELEEGTILNGTLCIYPTEPTFEDLEKWGNILLPSSNMILIYKRDETTVDASDYNKSLYRYAHEAGFVIHSQKRLDFKYYENKLFRMFIKRRMNVECLPVEYFSFLSKYVYVALSIRQS